jgi:hypothetical protein
MPSVDVCLLQMLRSGIGTKCEFAAAQQIVRLLGHC